MSVITVKISKVIEGRRLVFGWGSVCTKRDASGVFVQYRDTDGDEFPEDVTLDGWLEYAKGDRVLDSMHDEKRVGIVPFIFPMTSDVAEALGLLDALQQTGILVGAYIEDDQILADFQSGKLEGFSMGGAAQFEELPE